MGEENLLEPTERLMSHPDRVFPGRDTLALIQATYRNKTDYYTLSHIATNRIYCQM